MISIIITIQSLLLLTCSVKILYGQGIRSKSSTYVYIVDYSSPSESGSITFRMRFNVSKLSGGTAGGCERPDVEGALGSKGGPGDSWFCVFLALLRVIRPSPESMIKLVSSTWASRSICSCLRSSRHFAMVGSPSKPFSCIRRRMALARSWFDLQPSHSLWNFTFLNPAIFKYSFIACTDRSLLGLCGDL